MYKEEVEQYPENYSKSILDRIIEQIDTTRSLTIFSPSGFGKSALAKYMAFNNKYRHRYPDLRKINFIYINLNELAAEPFEELNSQFISQIETNKFKKFLEILARSLLESDGKLTSAVIEGQLSQIFSGDFKKTFYVFLDNYFKKQKGKFTFMILDGLEVLSKPEFDKLKEFIRNLRDQYKTKLDYIFFIGDLNYLKTINKQKWGGLTDLMIHKIILMPLSSTSESVLPMHFSQSVLLFNLFTRNSSNFKEKIRLVDYLAGGYPPYFKYFLRIKDLNQLRNPSYDREIEYSSERLYNSLTDEHKEVLHQFINNKKIDMHSRGFTELISLGIIKQEGSNLRLFSPFFAIFLKSKS